LNCPNCGKEILHEDATFCPKCGKSLAPEDETQQDTIKIPQKRTDLVLAAGILTIVAAAFSGGMSYIAIYQYISLVSIYGFSLIVGFLIFGVIGIIASAFAIAGATFMLKRKRIKISMLGIILLIVSVLATFITIEQYIYGYTDVLLLSEISTIILSIMSGIFVVTSRAEFT